MSKTLNGIDIAPVVKGRILFCSSDSLEFTMDWWFLEVGFNAEYGKAPFLIRNLITFLQSHFILPLNF